MQCWDERPAARPATYGITKARVVTLCANWWAFGMILGGLFGYCLRAFE